MSLNSTNPSPSSVAFERLGRLDASRFLTALNSARGDAWSEKRAWFCITVPCPAASRLYSYCMHPEYLQGIRAVLSQELKANMTVAYLRQPSGGGALMIGAAHGWLSRFMMSRHIKKHRHHAVECAYSLKGHSMELLRDLLTP